MNRLVEFRRGALSDANSDGIPDTVTTAGRAQSYTLDAQGNFPTVTTDGSSKTRTHNQQNQITSITGLTTPVYDSNGNLTTDERGQTLKFDAWNRLITVKNSGGTTIQTYAYDALGRRITENPGTIRHFYFSAAWQVLDERTGTSTSADTQYVYSPVYVDALVEFDRGATRRYVDQDANWDVTSISDTAHSVKERYVYDPYGQRTVLKNDWSVKSGGTDQGMYLGWQGKRGDVTIGYVYFNARWFSPTLFVFASQDRDRRRTCMSGSRIRRGIGWIRLDWTFTICFKSQALTPHARDHR